MDLGWCEIKPELEIRISTLFSVPYRTVLARNSTPRLFSNGQSLLARVKLPWYLVVDYCSRLLSELLFLGKIDS